MLPARQNDSLVLQFNYSVSVFVLFVLRHPRETTEQPQRELLITKLQGLLGKCYRTILKREHRKNTHRGGQENRCRNKHRCAEESPVGETHQDFSQYKLHTSAEHSTSPDPHLKKKLQSLQRELFCFFLQSAHSHGVLYLQW